MADPLFREPTDDIQREDPWSGSQGFLLGGMALPTRDDLATQYFDAAQVLVESVKRGDVEDYRLVNPALFLYRHSIELQLKAVIGATEKRHGLDALVDRLEAVVQANHGHALPAWMAARLREIAGIDPTSTAFRYGESYDPRTKASVCVPGELYIDVRHLQAVMVALRATLSRVRRAPRVTAPRPPGSL